MTYIGKNQNIKNLGFFVAPFTLPESMSLRKVTSHVTKNQNNTSEGEASVYIGEKPVEFQKTTLRRWVFLFGFFAVFRGSCLASSNEKPECEENSGFIMPV